MTIRGFQRIPAAVVSFLLLLSLHPAKAQQTPPRSAPVIRGAVTEEGSGIPLATVAVSLLSPGGEVMRTALTDEDGLYLLPASTTGSFRLRAQRVGYHDQERGPFTLQAGDTLTVDFRLSPAPLLLDSILVSVRRQGRSLGPGEQLAYGRLLDNESGEPIPQGLIRLLTRYGMAAASTLSDDDGLFWMVSPSAGSYRLQAERIGYKTSTGPELQLMLGDTIGVDFYLSMEAVVLEPLVVRATARPLGDRYDLTGMGGFLNRYSRHAKSGFGEFLIRDSIAKYEGRVISSGHMLMETAMSVRQVMGAPKGSGDPADRMGQVRLRGGCLPNYYIDGFIVPPDAVSRGHINPMALYPPQNLEAVEIYVRPMIPAEFFQGGFPCGVVSLWTRKDPATAGPSIPSWKKWLAGLGIVAVAFLVGG